MSNKQTPRSLEKRMSPSEMRDFIRDNLSIADDPKQILSKFGELLAKQASTNDEEKRIIPKELEQEGTKALKIMGLENHYPIAEIALERDRPLVIELCNRLVSELGCESSSEKMLVHIIGGCYARTLQISRYLVNTIALDHTSPNLNQFLGVLSKELDRAYRQMDSALATLRQIKSPDIRVNIKTNNAFVAQNQQLNTTNYDEKDAPK